MTLINYIYLPKAFKKLIRAYYYCIREGALIEESALNEEVWHI